MIPAPRHLSDPEALALWGRYRYDGARDPRDRLVTAFAPLVKLAVSEETTSRRVHREAEVLLSRGLQALSDSIDGYDPADGTSLEQFASNRVHAAVRDELRRGARLERVAA